MKKYRGFSLVELLAVVVILGILSTITIVSYNKYLDFAKNKKDEANKNILIMATKSFIQSNKQYAPKSDEDVVKINANVLKYDGYIKNELVNKKGEDCSNSYVKVIRKSGNKYSYQAVMLCGDDEDEVENDNLPVIVASFKKNTALTKKSFEATITGSGDKNLDVSNYNYKVYVKYIEDNNEDTEYTEVYNSGVINVGGKKKVSIGPINVSKYIDVTKNNDIKVSISATNSDGYKITDVISENAQDNEGPKCGNILGEADNDWLGKSDIFDENKKLIKPRTISVGCIDKEGSKCNKKRFTKSWPKKKNKKYVSTVKDTITISDNVGHTTECEVKVNVDVEAPTLRVTAYKANDNNTTSILTEKGPNKLKYREVKDGENLTIESSEFTNTVNGWLNSNNYKNGIAFKVEATDDIGIDKITLEYNKPGLTESASASEIKKIIGKQEVDPSKDITIKDDGVRYLKINAYDKAGNVSTIDVSFKMDRGAPSVPVAKIKYDKNKTSNSALYTGPNSRVLYKEKLWWGDFSGTDSLSGTDRYEYSVVCDNPTYGGVTNSSGYTKPDPGKTKQDSCYKIRQRDKAGNYSNWSGGYYLYIDLSTPLVSTFTGYDYFGKWRNVDSKRSSCDYWAARYNGSCPEGQYSNVIGRVSKSSYSNYNVKLKWEIINGPETFIYSGYTVDMTIFEHTSNRKLVQRIFLKSSSKSWGKGSYNSGIVSFTVPKAGDYEVWFDGNPQDPNYDQYMGWFRVS